ncbi:MAG: type VI secretion system lipoprotein TssJ [Chania sp.]
MRRQYRFQSLLTLAGWALLSGCSWFSSAPEIPPQQRQIVMQLNAAPIINPGPNGRAQPVKICIIETNLDGWSPPDLYQGTPCAAINTGGEVVSVSQYILAPLETRQYLREVPFDQDRWLVIAAEFQNMNEGKNLMQLKSVARTDFKPVVRVDGSNLTLLPNPATDVSKEE